MFKIKIMYNDNHLYETSNFVHVQKSIGLKTKSRLYSPFAL